MIVSVACVLYPLDAVKIFLWIQVLVLFGFPFDIINLVWESIIWCKFLAPGGETIESDESSSFLSVREVITPFI